MSLAGISWWPHLREAVVGLLLPPACAACGEAFAGDVPAPLVCAACRDSFAWGYRVPCPKCAMPLESASGELLVCGQCLRERHRFTAAVALGKYDGPLRKLVLRLKSGRDDPLALACGALLAEHWLGNAARFDVDAVVAIPIARAQRLFRAANLPDVLAEAVAARLRVPLLAGGLEFVRRVKRQTTLSPARRRRNLRKAMAASMTYDLRGTRVLVVDDVLTTGATADEAARALLAAGAASVAMAVIARSSGLE